MYVYLGQVAEIDVGSEGRLSKVGLENCVAGSLVRERNVDQLIKTALNYL